MAERYRKNELKIFLSDNEQRLLKLRCDDVHKNKSQVIRELIIYGFNYHVDYSELTEACTHLSRISGSLNQIARRANATGSIYKSDIDDMRKEVDDIWLSLKSTLSKHLFKKQ